MSLDDPRYYEKMIDPVVLFMSAIFIFIFIILLFYFHSHFYFFIFLFFVSFVVVLFNCVLQSLYFCREVITPKDKRPTHCRA